tara:strand:+ start:7392 stop:8318 length:927 start_codon:yes stop_codon:yes gene_type:complete
MATTTNITSSYAGEAAAGFLAAALLEGNTIAKGGIEVLQNIKYKEVMQKLATDANVIKNGTCDFTPTGQVDITERILQPEEFQVNLEFCTQKWLDSWEAISMGYSAYNNPPKDFTAYIMGHVAKMVNASTETNIWEGVNATEGQFDGFVPLAIADATVLDVASHAAVTAANVVEKLGDIVDLIPSALYGKDDMHIYISQNIARAYVRALGGFAATNSGVDAKSHMWYGDQPLTFDGVKLFVANGMNDDTAMATQKSNLFFGTGILNDQNSARLIDMSPTTGSQNFRVIMRYTAGIQYAIGSEIVLYHA